MKLHLLTSGKIITWKNLLVRNAPAEIRFTVPVPVYLLEHKSGLFLFDTGQQVSLKKYAENADFIPVLTDEERAVNLLAARGIAPGDIAGIIISHHHADHSDGLADFPGVPCYIRREELRYTCWADRCDTANWIFPEGEYDLCGDGEIILLPTPGHSDGHQSVLLTLDNGEKVLLAADAAYTQAALTQTPAENEKNQPYWQSIELLKTYAGHGVRVIPGHDPDQWDALKAEFN